MKKLIFLLSIVFLFLSCGNKQKYYTRRTVTASTTNNREEKEVYRMVEVRELESKKLIEKIENYY